MRSRLRSNHQAFSIIEAIVGIAMASVVVIVIGSTFNSITKLYTMSANRQQALGYAQGSLEILSEPAVQLSQFTCHCAAASCAANICTVSGQSCALRQGYTSCWLPNPGDSAQGPFHLVNSGGAWQLTGGSETLGSFTRGITIVDQCRNAATGELDVAGCSLDPNSKKATVLVSWVERGATKTFSLSKIITGWKDIP